MRLKKGFTLAEILIVLMLIGFIATMTIPSLMKGVTEAQYKTGYKKGLNAIVNLAAMEKISGQLPAQSSAANAMNFLKSLDSNLSVAGYASFPVNNGAAILADAITPTIQVSDGTNTTTFGSGATAAAAVTMQQFVPATGIAANTNTPWIITDDGLAYTVTFTQTAGTANAFFAANAATETTGRCDTKQGIAAATTIAQLQTHSCEVVIVDVNGLTKGPNQIELQGQSTVLENAQTKVQTLTADQYYIYVGSDGATAGPKVYTLGGRIAADLK